VPNQTGKLEHLEIAPKGVENSARAPAPAATADSKNSALAGVFDSKFSTDDRDRKARHEFLDTCSRSLKEGHWDGLLTQGVDCLADASLYSRGERSDQWVFLAIYGVDASSVSRHGKSCSSLHFFPASGYDRLSTDTTHSQSG
jgi:hypothetical protein